MYGGPIAVRFLSDDFHAAGFTGAELRAVSICRRLVWSMCTAGNVRSDFKKNFCLRALVAVGG